MTNQPVNKENPANLADPKNPTPTEANKANSSDKAAAPEAKKEGDKDGNKAEACATEKGACSSDMPADKKAAA